MSQVGSFLSMNPLKYSISLMMRSRKLTKIDHKSCLGIVPNKTSFEYHGKIRKMKAKTET